MRVRFAPDSVTNKKMSKTHESRSATGLGKNRAKLKTPDSKRPILTEESGALISRIREVIGDESTSSFGRRCGISESSLRSYINTGSKPPFDRASAIAAAGGVSVDWLISGRPPKFKPSDSAALRVENTVTEYAAVPRYDRAQAEYGAAGSTDDLSPDWSMLEVVLRAAEHKLKEPMTVEVADKILDLARAWTRHAEGRPDLLDRLDRVRTAAALLRPDH